MQCRQPPHGRRDVGRRPSPAARCRASTVRTRLGAFLGFLPASTNVASRYGYVVTRAPTPIRKNKTSRHAFMFFEAVEQRPRVAAGDAGLAGRGRKILCQDTDPRARSNNPEAPEDPTPYTSAGSPAPVCSDVAGRPLILIRQGRDRRSQTVTPLASGLAKPRTELRARPITSRLPYAAGSARPRLQPRLGPANQRRSSRVQSPATEGRDRLCPAGLRGRCQSTYA